MEAKLALLGASREVVDRFSAVDSKFLDASKTSYTPYQWSKDRWSLTRSEVACFESHLMLWKKIVSENYSVAVVMEDDLLFAENFLQIIQKLASSSESFDVVKLDYSPGKNRLGEEVVLGGEAVLRVVFPLASAAAYIISRRGAEELISMASKYCEHLDDFVWKPRPGYRTFQLAQPIAAQLMFCEESDTSGYASAIAQSERTSDSSVNGRDKCPRWFKVIRELRSGWRRFFFLLRQRAGKGVRRQLNLAEVVPHTMSGNRLP
jgi:GR25 family glycosyltransferase involved in LPS biosynthesis